VSKAIWFAAILFVLGLNAQPIGAELRASDNPESFNNSGVWYVKTLRKSYPSYVRTCGVESSTRSLSALSEDITKFRAGMKRVTVEGLSAASIGGSVDIGPIAQPFDVPVNTQKKEFSLYIDAFLHGPDGRVYEVVSAEIKGSSMVSAKGGKARFAFTIGRGHDFGRGGRVLLVASGDPISSRYPMDSCVLLGAKWVKF
jgi:hypothetical protein